MDKTMPISNPKEGQTRVLMSAYQCGAGMGSVSQIGWEWYSRMASRQSVTLATHTRNRAALEAQGAPIDGSEIIYIDTEWFAGPLYRLAKKLFPNSEHVVFMLSSIDFYVYDWVLTRQIKKRIKQGECWDVIHSPTPVSPSAVTRLHTTDIPVILGPLNGGLDSPKGFPELMKQDSGWLYPIRRLSHVLDAVTASTRKAAAILMATKATRRTFSDRYRSQYVMMLENAVDLKLFTPQPWPPAPSDSQPLKVVFVGRLIPFKALNLLFSAISRVKKNFPVSLTVVGDGPMFDEWYALLVTMQLEAQIEMVGSCELEAVSGYMQDAHVFCLPSVRESGGAVLLEAMASLRPVIAMDHGGPAELVDSSVGAIISVDNTEAAVSGLTAALIDVIRNPKEWQKKASIGRERVAKQWSWDSKMDHAEAIYQTVIAGLPLASVQSEGESDKAQSIATAE